MKISKVINAMQNKTVVFEWIPSHIGIKGNEAADKAAKKATKNRLLYRLPINIDEYNTITKKKIFQQWQSEWTREWSNRPCHLYKIKPALGDWKSSYRENRREEVVLSRLRTGCCRYLYQHYFQIENLKPKNKCELCNVTNSIEHLLLTCPKWGAFRIELYTQIQKLNLRISVETVLGEQFNHNILFSYLKNIKYFDLI